MDTPLQLRARAYADKVSKSFPGSHCAWGIAYDTYILATKDLISAGHLEIGDEAREQVRYYLGKHYSILGISKALGLDTQQIRSAIHLIRQEMI